MERYFHDVRASRFDSEVTGMREIDLETALGLKSLLSFTPEEIENIDVPLERLNYEGQGASSYSPAYDQQKQEHLKSFGIEVENLSHAETVTAFIIFSHIASLKLVEESGGNLDKATKIANKILRETRTDKFGYCYDLGEGVTYEGVRKSLGFAANSEGRVSEEVYSRLLKSILNSLNKKIDLKD